MSHVGPQVVLLVIFIYLSTVLEATEFGRYVLYEGYIIICSAVITLGSDKVLERYGINNMSILYYSIIRSSVCFIAVSLVCFIFLTHFEISLFGFSILEIVLLNCASLAYCLLILFSSFLLGNIYTKELMMLRIFRVLIYAVIIIMIKDNEVATIFLKVAPEFISCVLSAFALMVVLKKRNTESLFKIDKSVDLHSRYAAPFIVAVISGLVITQLDKLILTNYLSLADIAVLGYTQKYIAIYLIIGGAFSAVFAPIFYQSNGRNQLILDYNVAVLFNGAILSVTIGSTLFHLLFPAQYQIGIDFFILMMVGAFLNCATSYSSVLVLLHKERSLANMSTGCLSAIVFLICLITLTPTYQLLAPVIAFNVSALVLCIAQTVLIMKYKFRFNTLLYSSFLLFLSLLYVSQSGQYLVGIISFNVPVFSLVVALISSMMLLYYLNKIWYIK